MHEYDDPLWYDEGEEARCEDCHGTGVERWCPKCGFDLQKPRKGKKENIEPPQDPNQYPLPME